MSKYEDTRIVTFKEDYSIPTKSGEPRVLYKKNSVHAIHKTIVKRLEGKAKITVETLDYKKVEEKRKSDMGKHRKRIVEMSYQE